MNEEQFNAPSSCVECRTLYAFWLIHRVQALASPYLQYTIFFLLAITCASDGCDIYVDGLRIRIYVVFSISVEKIFMTMM